MTSPYFTRPAPRMKRPQIQKGDPAPKSVRATFPALDLLAVDKECEAANVSRACFIHRATMDLVEMTRQERECGLLPFPGLYSDDVLAVADRLAVERGISVRRLIEFLIYDADAQKAEAA